jgi:membrane associated rhomboid family serine protease
MDAGVRAFSVSFTRGSGIWDWLTAKLKRQPVFGDGEIEFRSSAIVVRGLQRTWLGISHEAEVTVNPSWVRNVWHDSRSVEFESGTRWPLSSHLTLRARNESDASKIADAIVECQPKESRFGDSSQFYGALRATGRVARVTPVLILISLAVYVALIIHTGLLGGFDTATLLVWGANYGSLTFNGEWWRLVSYAFLHVGLLHIIVNSWVLWSVGRLTERLYGSAVYLFLYLAAAICGAVASIAWDPVRVTVGASGAIFGVLGALLAYLLCQKATVPRFIFRAHWLPTALFTAFSIIDGTLQPQIDNMVHVGGFFAGSFLGWALARPLEKPIAWRTWTAPGLVFVLTLMILFSCSIVFAFRATRPYPLQQFLASNKWFGDGEVADLRLWTQLAAAAQAGTISGSDLSDQFEKNILPFWQNAERRMTLAVPRLPLDQKQPAQLIISYERVRIEAAHAVIEAGRSLSQDKSAKVTEIIQKLDEVQADVERQETDAGLAQGQSALSRSAPVIWLENVSWYNHQKCVEYPAAWATPVAPSDLESDGPSRAHGLGCLAQHLFLTRDFDTLDGLLDRYGRVLGDLPDGSSSYEAMTGGLSDLFAFGGIDAGNWWDRVIAWRLRKPGSIQPKLAEAQILMDWGYQARGAGTVDTISGNSMQLFVHRTRMAASLLPDIAQQSPWWFKLSIEEELYLSGDKKRMRVLYDSAHQQFAADLSLDNAILRTLMPRWGGSYAEVASFVNEQIMREPDGDLETQRFARLMWEYSSMEDDSVNIFRDLGVKWDNMAVGMAGLTTRYPKSDFIRNGLAKMACLAGDRSEYSLFASRLPKGLSASAWSKNVSVQSCNRKFGIKTAA